MRWSGSVKYHLLLPIILRENKIQPALSFGQKKLNKKKEKKKKERQEIHSYWIRAATSKNPMQLQSKYEYK